MARIISSKSPRGFTLLEVMLAVCIAAIIMAVAIPVLSNVLGEPKGERSFLEFDQMVQEARTRSRVERRNYVIVWGRDGIVLMRPEETVCKPGDKGTLQWTVAKTDTLDLHLRAALLEKGQKPEAIWTFWPNGTCEPAEVHYKGVAGEWTARYHPFTVQAEVRYD